MTFKQLSLGTPYLTPTESKLHYHDSSPALTLSGNHRKTDLPTSLRFLDLSRWKAFSLPRR